MNNIKLPPTQTLHKKELFTAPTFASTKDQTIEVYSISSLENIHALQNRNLQNPPSENQKIPIALDFPPNSLDDCKAILTKLIKLKIKNPNLNILSISSNRQHYMYGSITSRKVQYRLQLLCNISPELQHLNLGYLPNITSFKIPNNVQSLEIIPEYSDHQTWVLPKKLQNLTVHGLPEKTTLDFTKVNGLKNLKIYTDEIRSGGQIKFQIFNLDHTISAYKELITASKILSEIQFTQLLFLTLILINLIILLSRLY